MRLWLWRVLRPVLLTWGVLFMLAIPLTRIGYGDGWASLAIAAVFLCAEAACFLVAVRIPRP